MSQRLHVGARVWHMSDIGKDESMRTIYTITEINKTRDECSINNLTTHKLEYAYNSALRLVPPLEESTASVDTITAELKNVTVKRNALNAELETHITDKTNKIRTKLNEQPSAVFKVSKQPSVQVPVLPSSDSSASNNPAKSSKPSKESTYPAKNPLSLASNVKLVAKPKGSLTISTSSPSSDSSSDSSSGSSSDSDSDYTAALHDFAISNIPTKDSRLKIDQVKPSSQLRKMPHSYDLAIQPIKLTNDAPTFDQSAMGLVHIMPKKESAAKSDLNIRDAWYTKMFTIKDGKYPALILSSEKMEEFPAEYRILQKIPPPSNNPNTCEYLIENAASLSVEPTRRYDLTRFEASPLCRTYKNLDDIPFKFGTRVTLAAEEGSLNGPGNGYVYDWMLNTRIQKYVYLLVDFNSSEMLPQFDKHSVRVTDESVSEFHEEESASISKESEANSENDAA